MKKILATLLVVAMVASLCGMMLVSADAANLAAGKEVANATVNVANANYCANLTDGVIADAISTDNGVWFGYLYNKDKPENANTAENGIAIPTIDLGAVTELSSARIHIVDQADWGIAAPDSIVAQVSNDGENFTDVTTVTEFESGVAWVEFDLSGQSAQYVRLAIDLSTTWFFLDEIEIYGAASEGGNDEPVAPAEETFWLTHYNDGFVEGSGVIFTEEDTAGGWWLHVAFAPIAGAENAYEIVEITNGLSDGSAAKVAVPAGGFVWAANYGNNYPAIGGYGDDAIDYTSPNCTDAINRATAWAVGDKFVISGVDFETIPTSTPDVKWYDDAYVCTATIATYVPGSTDKPVAPVVKETIKIDGKLNDDGYDKAVWFADGLWQSNKETDPVIADLDVQYTVRSDDDNIYLTIKVNQGVDFAAALDPNAAFTQVGATDFRLWFLGDGMETRTFYDLLWDGEAFVPFREKVATEELTFAAETGDDYINLEIAIAKSSLKITDSFKLMVTYSTPNCVKADGTVAYNAFHMTACDEMPSGWSGNADAYETYACADIALGTKAPATGDEGILVFALLGLVAIAGAAVTIKSKI